MPHRLTFAAVAVAVALVAAPAAFATEQGGVKIRGNTTVNTTIHSATNVAKGNGSIAEQNIGGIKGRVEIRGNTLVSTRVHDALNLARGSNSKACQQIGGISSDVDCH